MNVLDLFAGAGGSLVAGQLIGGWKTVCAVESEPYRRAALLARQADEVLERFPIWDDVQTFDGSAWRGTVDLITAGFPCQPWSPAGKRLGEKDERNLWPDTVRIIREVGPRFVFLENTARLATHPYLRTIVENLEAAGYVVPWPIILAAEDVGAWHQRERLWVFAHAGSDRCHEDPQVARPQARPEFVVSCGETSDSDPEQLREPAVKICGGEKEAITTNPHKKGFGELRPCSTGGQLQGRGTAAYSDWWDSEPGVVRVVHGLAHRVDRVGALGDGWVPQVAAVAWDYFMKTLPA